MAELHLHLPRLREPCGYLPGRSASTEYRFMTDVSADELELLLEHGWRRFGASYFRPVCSGCGECVSLRIPVATFQPTKSQRRAWRKCSHLRVEVRTPIADGTRLALHHAWHSMREETRAWKNGEMTLDEYRTSFCVPHVCAREHDYFDGDRLVAVGLVDETRHALSSVYFFYDPDRRDLSLGVASVLFELEWARQRARSHLYLGYRVRECPSTAYKARYGPHELLEDRPELDEPPLWRRC